MTAFVVSPTFSSAIAQVPGAWPRSKPLAVAVSVMLEGWTDDAAPGIGPMGNPLKAGVLDLQARSWADYGPKVGAYRILDVLAAAKASAVFYVSGILAEHYPELMKTIVGAGHEVAAHSWGQNIIPATQSADDETRDLARCIDILERTAGRRPRGWLSPRCTPSARTTGLLAQAGFLWHADFFDSDLPCRMPVGEKSIVAMPFTMEVNDMPLSVRYGAKPEAYGEILQRIVSGWPSLGNRPGCLDITVHAHVFGRPAGAMEFARSLEIVRQHEEWAWLTTHVALAEMWVSG
jgi:hypothetical protein